MSIRGGDQSRSVPPNPIHRELYQSKKENSLEWTNLKGSSSMVESDQISQKRAKLDKSVVVLEVGWWVQTFHVYCLTTICNVKKSPTHGFNHAELIFD